MDAEISLWQAVLLLAVNDAEGVNCTAQECEQSRFWLTRPSEGLSEVCECAGLEMEKVIRLSKGKWGTDA